MIEPTSLLKPWPKSTDLVRITCFVRNHVSWNTFWETLISTIIEWPQIFGKAVSTVLGSLNALDTRYHTRSGQRGIIKTTSHVEPELNKEDDDENFESGLHNQKHKFEQYKFSISRFTAQSKLFEGKKTEWKFICYVVLFLAFSPASPVSSVMLTKHFPSDRCSFFIIRRRTLLQGCWAIFVSHTVRISRLYEQHLPLSVRYFLITKKAPI